MPAIDTIDSITIQATPEQVYRTVLDYPRMNQWFAPYHCKLIEGDEVIEGARIEHIIGAPPLLVVNRFVRTVQRTTPGRSIEETYDEGDLVGTGTWRFEPADTTHSTTASFHCQVKSRTLPLHLSFALTGARAHNVVYGRLLAALKRHCERTRRPGEELA